MKKTTLIPAKILSRMIAATIFVLSVTACTSRDISGVGREGMYFDTLIQITLYEYPYGQADHILDECMELCSYYDSLLSSENPASDIYRINEAHGTPVTISAETADVIESAIRYGEISDGLIDITSGGLIALWDIEHKAGLDDADMPDADDIAEALTHVDYRQIKLSPGDDPDTYQVTLTDPEAKMELGCIGKGFIADKLNEKLRSLGVSSALINLGGNVSVIGHKPGADHFRIGIQYPFRDRGETITYTDIHDTSVVSSGVYERYFIKDNNICHHILDLRTGYPSDSGATSATVRCDSSTDADALSTLCLILGPEEGISLIEKIPGTEVLFVTGENELISSSGWQEQFPVSH